ncbi:hypothetical protein DPMN_127213 [Dreissena polymorpha]|uniref:Uncharacterized protein n=1 Tax=Dreissena polymorpha TaxID=45954 RepID=A0A9D4JUN1_DREPO|nr:hypothetical protein DPMN_127210 [Dreissena polymorpha]KAH3825338.1 hypothetical protein DPMN_127213 [Dreissena polymorpha]
MKQKDDMDFALLLNRVRIAKHTDKDIEFLKSREIEQPKLSQKHSSCLCAELSC